MIDAPVVSVHIPHAFRSLVSGRDEITASGDTVGEVLESVCHEYPAIRSHLISSEGDLPAEVAIFLGARSIREMQGLATPIELAEILSIVPVVSI